MKYMGSKNRIAKHILPIMLEYRKPNVVWVEPFVGGANMIDKVTGPRIGADFNPYVIEALKSIRDHLNDLPQDATQFTESDYQALSGKSEYRHKGYAGFAFSYGGKWMGGWSRGKNNKNEDRDYVAESYRNALKQSPKLQGVQLVHSSYSDLEIPKNSLIYCDPPYAKTTAYKTGDFDHPKFWQWCREKASEGHTVFISEYNAPEDFLCVWEKSVNSSLTKDTGSKKATEKLFLATLTA